MDSDFLHVWRRAVKKSRDEDELRDSLREHSRRVIGGPEGFADELFAWFLADRPDDAEAAEKLSLIPDMLDGRFEDRWDIYTPEDWEMLRDLVNGYAREMDMDDVTNIMRLVVDRGGFH